MRLVLDLKGVRLFPVALLLLLLLTLTHVSQGSAAPGCVEKLLQPPTKGKYLKIARPGRKADDAGSGGQEMLIYLKFGAVPHCESYGRTVETKVEVKRSGQPWKAPKEGRAWVTETNGLKGTTDAFETGELKPALTEYMATCEGSRRPSYRVAVKVEAKLVDTKKIVATSPITHLPIAYEPPGAARC